MPKVTICKFSRPNTHSLIAMDKMVHLQPCCSTARTANVSFMRTVLNFTIAILLLLAFVGSGAFFFFISKDVKLERIVTDN